MTAARVNGTQADRIAERVKDVETAVFEASGHFPWIDEPDRFFEVMEGWLQ